tara:strand:+ start:339 stop:1010 length:672 start_codon:yes stop_codon:yes gene_type:complete
MSCDHKLIAEHLTAYIEGSLPQHLSSQCEAVLEDCLHCQQSLDKAQEIYRLAQDWQEQSVPPWSRMQHAVRPPHRQLSWHSWTALACSLLAVCLVVLQLEVRVDDGLHISFGGKQSEAQLQELLALELQQYQSRQNLAVTTQIEEYIALQNLNNQMLLTEWMDRNREERQDDLNFLMSGWESQRSLDRQRVNQQLNILAENQIDSNDYLNNLLRTVGLPQGAN